MSERHGIAQTQMPIMKAVMSLAKDLDLQVIAEGAESDDEVARIQGLGCGYAQGFAFSKAVSGEDFIQLLSKDAKNRKQAQRDAEQKREKLKRAAGRANGRAARQRGRKAQETSRAGATAE